jgi:hypothetical protein
MGRPAFIAVVVAGAILVSLAIVAASANGPGSSSEPASEASPADRFDADRAFERLRAQVELGPRPAGSPASRRLAELLRAGLPKGRFQRVPGDLRNVVARIRGRDPDRYVVVGAHYDTKDIPGFVGANDGAAGTAVVVELARTIQRKELDPTVKFVFFDGEESPAGTPDSEFGARGLRGSKVAAPRFREAEAMILLDFVGDRDLEIPRERLSSPGLWRKLRVAARRVGAESTFPPATRPGILDDHVPFLRQGVPAIDLIDFEFPCFHRTCDDLSAVSAESLDATGETVYELLRTL